MVELTRRWFLFGTAAAIAVATTPSVLLPEEVVQITTPHNFLSRRIRDIIIQFEEPLKPEGLIQQADQWARISCWVSGRKYSFCQTQINTRGLFRWVSMDDAYDPIVLPLEEIRIEVEFSDHDIPAIVQFTCADTIDEGPPIHLIENYRIVNGVAETSGPFFLEVDNSLEARNERKRIVAPEWDDTPEWDDVDDED